MDQSLPKLELKPGVLPSRINRIDQTYFQAPGKQPTLVESRCVKTLKSDESPVYRDVLVGPGWTPLYLGWLDGAEVELVILKNPKPEYHIQPSKEERELAESKVVEVAVTFPHNGLPPPGTPYHPLPFALLSPGDGLAWVPVDVKHVRVRCKAGFLKLDTTIYPS